MIRLINAKVLVDNNVFVYIIYNNQAFSDGEDFSRYLKEKCHLKSNTAISKFICSLPTIKYNDYISSLKEINHDYPEKELDKYLKQQLGIKEHTTHPIIDCTDIISPG